MTQMGKYELLRHLGSDSLTEDHLGHRTDARANKKVLIKRLLPALVEDAELVHLFLEQARRASHLYHPNIIQIHDMGQEGDVPFIVLEHASGHTLQQVIDQASHLELPISLGIVSHIILRICSGLDYAHSLADADNKSLEIIHGGLNPGSVLLSPEGDIKLIDFCTAGAMNYLAAKRAQLQLEQRAYMSPEQCQGQALDVRSDVFSVGVLLYELACRRRLFRRNTIQATMRAIVDDPFPPPSAVVSDLPDEVESAIMRALRRPPQERFKTIKLMQEDLEQAFHALEWKVGRDVVAGYLSNLFPEGASPADPEEFQHPLPLLSGKSIEVIPADHDEVTQREEIFTSADLPTRESQATLPPAQEEKAIQWSDSREEHFDSLTPVPALQTGHHGVIPEKRDILPASNAEGFIEGKQESSGDVTFSAADSTAPPPAPSRGVATATAPPGGAAAAAPLSDSLPGGPPAADHAPPHAPSSVGGDQASPTVARKPLPATLPPPPPTPVPGAASAGTKGAPLISDGSVTSKAENPFDAARIKQRRWSVVVVTALVVTFIGVILVWKATEEAPPVSIEVLSNPPGASVYLNGIKNFKATPTFLGTVPAGREHSIVLVKKGYKPWMKIYSPQTLLPMQIKAELKPSAGARASLSIKVNVAGAQVYFDGEMRGETPVVLRGIISGKPHYLVIKKEGYGEVSREIKALQPLEKRGIEIHLAPRVAP